jgi:hypothetical protein
MLHSGILGQPVLQEDARSQTHAVEKASFYHERTGSRDEDISSWPWLYIRSDRMLG